LKLEEEFNCKSYTTIKFPFKKGDKTLLAGYTIDITERKIAERLLSSERQTLVNILEGTNAGTWNWNIQTGNVAFNERWAEIMGYSISELEPISIETWINHVHPDDLPGVNASLGKLFNKETDYYDVEFRQSHKDGSWVWVNARGKLVEWTEDGQPLIMSGIHLDITKRKIVEIELIKEKEHAQESDRLKSAFLANMSHEIRTPMNGILGFAELLKEPGLTGEEQKEYIRIIEKSGARMLNTINDIVDISKIESGLMKLDLKEANLNEQIEYIYNFFKPEAEAKGIRLSFKNSLTATAATIQTDREKLYAILTNLVKNAIKYTEKGSIEFGYDVVVETRHALSLQEQNTHIETRHALSPQEQNTHIETRHALSLQQPHLQFYVKDTGIGIPTERQAAIFDRFVQADIEDKKAQQGSGLGLAITKSYVEMLGGEIRVESREGQGSTFYFTLPYRTKTQEVPHLTGISPVENTNIETKSSVTGLKILIAEDDETSEMFMSILAKSFSREILKARTGLEVIDSCRNNPDLDLILMDIQMPEMGGYEATRHIRQFNKKVVIIAQTAYGLSGDRSKAIEAGCNDYISKPINIAELTAKIQLYF